MGKIVSEVAHFLLNTQKESNMSTKDLCTSNAIKHSKTIIDQNTGIFLFVSSTRNNLMKEKNDLEGVQEMSIDQLHMYQLTPKKTFKKKTKPPLDIVIFKVNT